LVLSPDEIGFPIAVQITGARQLNGQAVSDDEWQAVARDARETAEQVPGQN
jgi:hypothetical protein